MSDPITPAKLTREEWLVMLDSWRAVGNGRCYMCGTEGPMFRRNSLIDSLVHCADCRDEIRRAYRRTNPL